VKPRLPVPRLTLWANGTPLPGEGLRALQEVRVAARLSLPTQCDLTFTDPPGPLGGLSGLIPGTLVRLEVEGFSGVLFSGEVTVQEQSYGPAGERTLQVRAYDLLHRLRKRQPVHSYVQVSLGDLARELAGGAGLQVKMEGEGAVWQQIIQSNQSDLELLSGLAAQCGCYLAVRDKTLHLLTLAGEGSLLSMNENITLELGKTLLEARFELSAEAVTGRVSTQGWNAQRGQPQSGQAASPRRGRFVLAAARASQTGGKDERTLSGALVQDERHAQLLAQAELDRRDAHMVTVWGVAEGSPELQPGAQVNLVGVDAPWVGRYPLTSVTHTLDTRQGFLSEFSSAPPPPPPANRAAWAELGEVTRVDDAQKQGRVRVRLSAFGNLETGWLQVVCPGAGQNKGIIALPDVGDQVLVVFPQGEAAQGMVLGGLYARQTAPDNKIGENRVGCFVFATRDGQRITLDDTRQTILVENKQGSLVELSPDKVRVLAKVDLDIAAPGRTITIRADKINFERA
jgi:phage baseplate assembly protein V